MQRLDDFVHHHAVGTITLLQDGVAEQFEVGRRNVYPPSKSLGSPSLVVSRLPRSLWSELRASLQCPCYTSCLPRRILHCPRLVFGHSTWKEEAKSVGQVGRRGHIDQRLREDMQCSGAGQRYRSGPRKRLLRRHPAGPMLTFPETGVRRRFRKMTKKVNPI